MSVFAVAMEKTREQIRQRRLRLEDFFADFDRLHTGRLTAAQFARVLTLNHILLSDEERAALAEAFRATGPVAPAGKSGSSAAPVAAAPPNAEVRYTAFLEALRASSSAASAVGSQGGRATGTPAAHARLSQQEEDGLRPVVQLLRHAMRTRGLDVVSAFRDMDRLNTGLVTVSQFERCMPMVGGLTPEVVRLFAKKYGDGKGSVAYMRWCREVDESLGSTAGTEADPRGSEMTVGRGSAAPVTPRGSAADAFGSISAGHVGTYTNAGLSAAELVRIIREQCALYRLRCDDALRDFDRHQRGTVSAAQFESALGRIRFVRFALTHENVSTLVAAYATDPAVTLAATTSAIACAAIRVNYESFLFDVNPKNFDPASTSTATAAAAATHAADAPGATNYYTATHAPDTFMASEAERAEAARILDKVARLVRTNRIFLSPVLRDFDRVRKAIHEHRTCTRSRFARGLATQNIMLAPAELQVLVKKYTVPSVDGSPSDDVNYYQFVQDVDPSQAQKPAAAGGPGALARGGQVAPAAHERPVTSLDEVLSKLAQQCVDRELRIGEFFLDFDPLRSGVIGRAAFVSALTIAGVHDLTQAEIDALVEAFPSRNARGSVDVHAFLREMGAYAPSSVPSGIAASLRPPTGSARPAGDASTGATAAPTVATGSTRGRPHASTAGLTAEESTQLARVLERVRQNVAAHNALLMPFFADFDSLHLGRITANHFTQALARHRFPLDAADTALLCRAYAVSSSPSVTVGKAAMPTPAAMTEHMVAYRRFVADVSDEGPAGASAVTATTHTSGPTSLAGTATATAPAAATPAVLEGGTMSTTRLKPAAAPAASVESALSRVCCFLQERRPRLPEFFADGDELRHGVVTRARFRHALGMLGLELSESEMVALEEGYATGTARGPAELRTVDYPTFLAEVQARLDAGMGLAAVGEKRTGATTELLRSMKASADGSAGPAQTQAEAALATTLARVRRTLATRRTTTLPAFRAYDRARKGVVKEGQFFACLASVLGGPLTPLESAVVTRGFTVGNGEMGYLRFSEEVDNKAFAAVS